jgi:hypothetical protein
VFDQTARLARVTLCECGHRFIDERVEVGELYQVDTTIISKAEIVCGGCGQIIPVKMVAVVSIGKPAGLMPIEALEILDDGTPRRVS